MTSESKRRKPGGLKGYGVLGGKAFTVNSRGEFSRLTSAERQNLIEMNPVFGSSLVEDHSLSDSDEETALLPSQSSLQAKTAQPRPLSIGALIKKIFKPLSLIDVEQSTLKILAVEIQKKTGLPLPEIDGTNFPLGQTVSANIIATHFMMSCIADDKRREEFVLVRVQQLVDYLKIIFNHSSSLLSEVPDTFYQELADSLYMSALLSYDEERNKKYTKDYYVVGCYVHQKSLSDLQKKLKQNRLLCEKNLVAVLSKAEMAAALRKVDSFNQEIVQAYKATTVPILKRLKSLFIITFGGLLGLGMGYGIKMSAWWLLIPLFLGAFVGFRAAVWYRNSREARELTPKKNQSYFNTFGINFDAVKKEMEGSKEDKNAARFSRHVPREDKIGMSVRAHYQRLVSVPWKQCGVRDATTAAAAAATAAATAAAVVAAEETKASHPTIPVYRLNYAAAASTASSSQDAPYQEPTAQAYDKAYGAYRRVQAKNKAPSPSSRRWSDEIELSELAAETKGDAKGGSTYARVAYQLSPDAQARGFLAVEKRGASKGFFEYGKYKHLIDAAKLEAGVWEDAFSSIEGEFNRLKYMNNLKQYELKLFSGERLVFEKKDNEQLKVTKAGTNITESVPCWQVVGYHSNHPN